MQQPDVRERRHPKIVRLFPSAVGLVHHRESHVRWEVAIDLGDKDARAIAGLHDLARYVKVVVVEVDAQQVEPVLGDIILLKERHDVVGTHEVLVQVELGILVPAVHQEAGPAVALAQQPRVDLPAILCAKLDVRLVAREAACVEQRVEHAVLA
eukprot:359379-Chlamydomonas_euryale.AAC.7